MSIRVEDFTGVAQKIGVMIKMIRTELNQFKGRNITEDVGSKTENRLDIIIFIK